MSDPSAAQTLQREYYAKTAAKYDELRAHNNDGETEHVQALRIIDSLCEPLGITSILDVGAGTGRAMKALMRPGRTVRGIEPVPELIEQGELAGLPKGSIIHGDGSKLPFADNSFDAVIESAVLHHVPDPSKVIAEMLRVASKAIFIDDCNRFGQGSLAGRLVKYGICQLGLWKLTRWIQTGGKMYSYSDGDGIFYSYSVFDNRPQISNSCPIVHTIPTKAANPFPFKWGYPVLTSPHVLLCGIKPAGVAELDRAG